MNWNVPVAPAFVSHSGGDRGVGGYSGQYGGQGLGQQAGGYGQTPKDDGKKNMMMGAAAGVAVGAIGGLVLADALGMFFLPTFSTPQPVSPLSDEPDH